MAGIRAKHTKPELLVRRALHAQGFRFRLHQRDLPGSPDIILTRHRVVVFVHGCFWHHHEGCSNAKIPGTRTDFWRDKLIANRERDIEAFAALSALGWRIAVVWECALRQDAAFATGRLMEWIVQANSDNFTHLEIGRRQRV